MHNREKDKAGEAAQFLTKLHDFDALPGGVARFIACVIGSPKPDLKWYKFKKLISHKFLQIKLFFIHFKRFKNGDEISIDNRKYFVEYQDNGMIKFEVRDVCDGDLGKYRCHASNIYGYDNSIAQLNFESKRLIYAIKRSVANGAIKPLLRYIKLASKNMVDQSVSVAVQYSPVSLVSQIPMILQVIIVLVLCIITLVNLLSSVKSRFPCDDNYLKNISEYVFICNTNNNGTNASNETNP